MNTYYFFVTLYFKVRNFVLWFYHTYGKIKAFFGKRSYEKREKQQRDYYKQEYQDYGGYKQRSEERKRQREREEESYSYEDEEDSYQEKSYEKKQDSSYKDEYEQESKKQEQSSDSKDDFRNSSEFRQFFRESHYEVLDVSFDDDFKTIKKKYRALVMKYHPDKHYGDDRYTEIMQKINGAYEYFEKQEKKK